MKAFAALAAVLSGALLLWRLTPPPRSEPVPAWGDVTLFDVAMQESARHGDAAPFSIRYVQTTEAAARAYAFQDTGEGREAGSPAGGRAGSLGAADRGGAGSGELAGAAAAQRPVYLVVARGYYRGATPQGTGGSGRTSLATLVDAASGQVIASRVSSSPFADLSRLGRVVTLHFVPEAGGGR